jgi:perosamine synthetase
MSLPHSSRSTFRRSDLAIHGGPPAVPQGPPDWPPADAEIRAALESAYADGSWGRYQGPHGERLAASLAEMHEVEFVSLCCSGTFAVELALRALRVGAGDEVILAGYDFPGNFRAIEAVGAHPVLVDVARENWNLDPEQLSAARSDATRAILVSHLHGGMVPMREVMEFAREQQLVVVEDACQAAGAIVQGKRAGSWGNVGVLSFGGSKLLTAGRGGAILTRHADVQQRAKIFCEQGNHAFPLSELQAAVLLPQVAKLAARHAQRRTNATRLYERVSNLPGLRSLVNRTADVDAAYYKLAWQFRGEELHGASREMFLEAVQAEGVALHDGFRGFVHRGPKRCRKVGDLPNSRDAAAAAVVLHHPVLLEAPKVIDQVAMALEKVTAVFGENPG